MFAIVKHVKRQTISLIFARNVTRSVTKTISKKNSVHERHKLEKLMFGGVIETKKEKSKRIKKQLKDGGTTAKTVEEPADDSESFWLSQLSSKDFKIFRKTASGRYKAVDNEKLFKSVKCMLDDRVNKEMEPPKIILPEIIVKNVTSVPMLSVKREMDSRTSVLDVRNYPAVTRILSDTMSDSSKAALENWKQKMIAELGPDGFSSFNREQLSFGARFHGCVRQYLQGITPAVDGDLQLVWHSVKQILTNITDVRLVESNVAHSKLLYKGVVDCVASFRNIPSVIEWKVSQKPKMDLSATFDAPLQVTAYLGALSYDNEHRTNLKNGLIVVAYKDGSPATVLHMDEQVCHRHWAQWVRRLQQYWLMAKSSQKNEQI